MDVDVLFFSRCRVVVQDPCTVSLSSRYKVMARHTSESTTFRAKPPASSRLTKRTKV
jgi:hypothetical protein